MANNYTVVPEAFGPWRAGLLSLGLAKSYLMLSHFQIIASAAALGVGLHISLLLPYEVEQFMYRLLGGLLVSWAGYFFLQLVLGFSVLESVVRVLLASSSFCVGIFVSIGVYRFFFHRLRRFTGPRAARLTKFYSVSRAARTVQYYKDVALMHEEYGDFVRTVLQEYLPRITEKADLLISQLTKHQEAVDASAWTSYLSFDIMGAVAFSKDFGSVASGQEHPAIKGVHDHMSILGIGMHVPWFLNIAARIPGATAGYATFMNWCADEIEAKQKTWKQDQEPTDIMSWLIKAFEEQDPAASPSVAALHEDSRAVVIAGSETTATTLASVLYYLCKHPATYRKLQAAVDAAMPTPADWSYEKARSVAFVDDVINETLRLKPAVIAGGYRQTPPEGLQVDERFVPGNTTVFVPTQLIQTDERYWPRAREFIPERFSSKSNDLRAEDAPFLPFTLGLHTCPGKNLAWMSMRTTLSKIAQHFDLSFGPGESGDHFDTEALDCFTMAVTPLMVRFTSRDGSSSS